jgi:hypothetical protein
MLYEAARHEPLTSVPWNADRAHAALRAIAADMERVLGDGDGWPPHPLDDPDAKAPHHSVYLGAAGALWALWHLAQEGAVGLAFDPCERIGRVHANYLATPDTESVVPSYFLGEAGILLVAWRMTGAPALADRLHEVIAANIPNPTNEALWAAPGTMVAAWYMLHWTGEARWRELYRANVEHVWSLWQRSPHAPCMLWTQDLYGSVVQLLGAGHGFAGNAYGLAIGADELGPDRRAALAARCAETLRVTALVEDGCVNWPPGVGPPRPGRASVLVQWCHGAPGIVTSFAGLPAGIAPDLDDLLVKGGHLIWKAGPLAKGFGLCHGTAGNGYAFLALHARTGDAVWLDRARAFAMHAIVQQERMSEKYGRGRYSLWTGDPGLAVYLWHCLRGAGGLPGLDVL